MSHSPSLSQRIMIRLFRRSSRRPEMSQLLPEMFEVLPSPQCASGADERKCDSISVTLGARHAVRGDGDTLLSVLLPITPARLLAPSYSDRMSRSFLKLWQRRDLITSVESLACQVITGLAGLRSCE